MLLSAELHPAPGILTGDGALRGPDPPPLQILTGAPTSFSRQRGCESEARSGKGSGAQGRVVTEVDSELHLAPIQLEAQGVG